MRNRTDNYRSTAQAIATRILNSSLAHFIGYGGLSGHEANRLRQVQAGDSDLGGWSFISVSFRRAGTDASLEVRCESVNREWRTGPDTDSEGNEWAQYQLTTQVGYPSHGSEDPGTVLARAELIREAALLAAAIQAEFGGRHEIHRMTATAAQVAEKKEKAAKEKLVGDVRRLVDANRSKMRVGSERMLEGTNAPELVKDIPSDRYTVDFTENNGEVKKYSLYVTQGVGACLTRLA